MIAAVAVVIERKNQFRVKLSKATAPEDTLPLTKSLLSGARKSFPDQPITLSVYDPSGAPILKAHYRPEEGVRYEVVHAKGSSEGADSAADTPRSGTATAPGTLPRGGLSDKDRKFADWAMGKEVTICDTWRRTSSVVADSGSASPARSSPTMSQP